MAKKDDVNQQDKLEVQVSEDMRRGVYANTVNVVATNTEVTISFIYTNPTDNPTGTLVSRVIIPPEFTDKLSEIIKKTAEEHKKKEK